MRVGRRRQIPADFEPGAVAGSCGLHENGDVSPQAKSWRLGVGFVSEERDALGIRAGQFRVKLFPQKVSSCRCMSLRLGACPYQRRERITRGATNLCENRVYEGPRTFMIYDFTRLDWLTDAARLFCAASVLSLFRALRGQGFEFKHTHAGGNPGGPGDPVKSFHQKSFARCCLATTPRCLSVPLLVAGRFRTTADVRNLVL